MSTRSVIAIRRPAGHYSAIYCHSDGYLSWNGRLLLRHWHSLRAASQLFEHGDMSSLGEELGERHDFDWRSKPGYYTPDEQARMTRWCKFYGRDRKSKDAPMFGSFDTFADLHTAYDGSWATYLYLWAGDTWWTDSGDGSQRLTPLVDAVRADMATRAADDDSYALRHYEGFDLSMVGPSPYLARRSARLGYGQYGTQLPDPMQPVAATMGRRRVRL